MRRALCPKMSFTCSIVDMSYGNAHNIVLMKEIADSGKMCSGVVILGLALALVLAQ